MKVIWYYGTEDYNVAPQRAIYLTSQLLEKYVSALVLCTRVKISLGQGSICRCQSMR